jgi:hypothetical protein
MNIRKISNSHTLDAAITFMPSSASSLDTVPAAQLRNKALFFFTYYVFLLL